MYIGFQSDGKSSKGMDYVDISCYAFFLSSKFWTEKAR
jgi:hypothetical protein